jgi:rare lipoprotein A
MTKKHMIPLLAAVVMAGGLSAQKVHAVAHPRPVAIQGKTEKIQFGIASFYANKFHGRQTANGEIFSQKKLTAASNTLPLNTWAKVTNLRNKRSVYVRITDRMHFKNKRLIDLSRAAAHQLGYTGRGLTRVKVESLGKHKPKEVMVEEKQI